MSEEAQLEMVTSHNYYVAWKFLTALQQRINCPIIFPPDLTPAHQEWEQEHFQALWLSIIAEKCTELHLIDGWEFSNGCAEEFTHVMQLKLGLPRHDILAFYNTKEDEADERQRMKSILVYNQKGESISLHDGYFAISRAVGWLKKNRFSSERLEKCLENLRWTARMLADGFYQ